MTRDCGREGWLTLSETVARRVRILGEYFGVTELSIIHPVFQIGAGAPYFSDDFDA